MSSKSLAVLFIVLQLTQNLGCNADCSKCNCGEKSNLWDTVKETVGVVADNKLVKYGAGAGVALVAAPALVSAAGFGAAGVGAHTLAALIHSSWFGGAITGPTGAVFSYLQSIGAAGMGLGGSTVVAGTGGATVKVYETIKGESTSDDKNCHECCHKLQTKN